MIFIKLVTLFMAIFFTILNTYTAMLKERLEPIQVLLQIISIFVFVTIQFRLYE
jgi:hypothetical protein